MTFSGVQFTGTVTLLLRAFPLKSDSILKPELLDAILSL